MTGHYGPEEWWYADGATAANVRAAVFEGDQSTLAAIYADAGLTMPLPNPTTTDGSGMLEFYAVDGNYWIFVGDENYGDSVLANLSPPVTGTGGALLISNNLSDLSNVVTARANLGLGTAALADTGVGPTNVILGNDARLTDARTPTAHAATHGVLGSDPVTIAESQVTNLVADLAGKQPLDTDLTAIAALTPANDDIIQRKAGVWTNRTVAQYKTDLAITAADVGAQPIATIDAKGDLYAGTGDNATSRRSVGTNGQVLTADSSDPTGLSWASPGTDPNAQSRLVIDAKGDLYAGTANDATTRLPVGTDGQALRANSATGTGLEWDTLTAGDVGADPAGAAAAAQAASQPLDADLTAIAALTPANDDIIQRKAGVWTNRTVAQYKADQAYTPAEIGAVPTTRNLTAGIAMSGGGDLSADRTFDVDLGTSAGTAAEGNDSRIVGAQQRSTITTKGDLYVGTASATTVRRGVGTDGQVLTADSAEADGVKWATAGVDPGAQQRSTLTTKGDIYAATASATTTRLGVGTNGQIIRANSATATGLEWGNPGLSFALKPRAGVYSQAGAVNVTRSSKAVTLNAMYLRPFSLTDATNLTAIAFELTSSTATALVRLGIYTSDANSLPATRLVDFGTFTADTIGLKNVTGLSQALSANTLYWLATVFQTAAPNVRHSGGWNPWVSSAAFPTGAGAGWNDSYVQTGVSGALPASIGTIADTDSPTMGVAF